MSREMEMLETLRRGYEAFSRGDMSAVAGLATRDVEWGTTGAFPGIDGLYRGPEVIQQWADAIHSDWGDVEVGLDEVLHDGGDVVVVAERLRGRDRARGDDVEDPHLRRVLVRGREGQKTRGEHLSQGRPPSRRAVGVAQNAWDRPACLRRLLPDRAPPGPHFLSRSPPHRS